MNRKQHIAPSYTVRFRRWSRKGYAAFASLGRCVTIGQVCKSITERALTKLVAPAVPCDTKQTENGRDNDDTPTMPVAAIELLLATLSPQITAAECPAPCGHTLYNSINRGIDALNASCDSTLHSEEQKELQDAFNASIPIFTHQL